MDFRVGYAPLGLGLQVESPGAIAGMVRALPLLGEVMAAASAPDIEVGDPMFDEAFLVRGHHPDAVRRFLGPDRRYALGQLLSHYRTCKVTDTDITWTYVGEPQAELLETTLRRFVDIASIITDGNTDIAHAIDTMAAGDHQAGLNELAAITGPGANEAEFLHTVGAARAGQLETAEDLLDDLESRLPKEQELQAIRSQIGTMAHPTVGDAPIVFDDGHHDSELPPPPLSAQDQGQTQPTHTTQPAPPPPVDERTAEPTPTTADETDRETTRVPPSVADAEPPNAGDPTGQLAALQQLFGDGPSRAVRVFRDHFAGHEVTWTGPVRRVSSYQYDLDFDGSGTKAVVGLGRVGGEGIHGMEIDAVLQLDADAAVAVGDQVTFTGTLQKLDGLSKNLFVASASLITGAGATPG